MRCIPILLFMALLFASPLFAAEDASQEPAGSGDITSQPDEDIDNNDKEIIAELELLELLELLENMNALASMEDTE